MSFYLNKHTNISFAQSAGWGTVEYTDSFSGYDTKQSDGETPVKLVLWGNVEYPFIAIPPRSPLVQSGSTW